MCTKEAYKFYCIKGYSPTDILQAKFSKWLNNMLRRTKYRIALNSGKGAHILINWPLLFTHFLHCAPNDNPLLCFSSLPEICRLLFWALTQLAPRLPLLGYRIPLLEAFLVRPCSQPNRVLRLWGNSHFAAMILQMAFSSAMNPNKAYSPIRRPYSLNSPSGALLSRSSQVPTAGRATLLVTMPSWKPQMLMPRCPKWPAPSYQDPGVPWLPVQTAVRYTAVQLGPSHRRLSF